MGLVPSFPTVRRGARVDIFRAAYDCPVFSLIVLFIIAITLYLSKVYKKKISKVLNFKGLKVSKRSWFVNP